MQTPSKSFLDKQKTAGPILKRSAVFLGCFVVVSGIIGPRIVSHGLVGKYGFQIYGGAGKALLFGALALLLLVWRRQAIPKLPKWRAVNLVWLGLACIATLLEWQVLTRLIGRHHPGAGLIIAAHGLILLSVLSLLVCSFGLSGLRVLWHAYKKELLYASVLAVAFFGFLYLVYGLWRVLATVVLKCVRTLLGWVGIAAVFVPPRTLIFNKFGISVSEFCSGIDSIALFSALYGLIGVLDWQRFNHKKYLTVFLPALMVLFGFNILRVFALILGGYYINPQIAFSLFHTYAGMVFFIIYSGLFWGVSYRRILNKPLARSGYTTKQ